MKDSKTNYKVMAMACLGGCMTTAAVMWFFATSDFIELDPMASMVLEFFAGFEVIVGVGLYLFFSSKDKKVL